MISITSNFDQKNLNILSFSSKTTTFTKRFNDILHQGNTADRNELLELLRLFKTVKSNIKNKNKLLGKGYKGNVYEIDSQYALKIPTHFRQGINIPVFIQNSFSSLKSYFGNKIAIMGDYSILKNIGKHIPIGIPLSMSSKDRVEEANIYYDEVFLPKFANLPQKAFDNIAEDCNTLNNLKDNVQDLKYSFDYMNPNNFVIKNNKILILDDIVCDINASNTISDLFKAMLCYKEFGVQNSKNKTNLENYRKIYKKIILAGIKKDLPLGYDKSSFLWKKATEELCCCNASALDVVKTLECYKSKCQDKISLIKLVQRYLNSTMKKF